MYWKIALHVYEGVPSKWKKKGKGKKTGKKSRFFPLNSLALCMWVWPWLRKSQCPARSFIVQFGRTHFRLNFFLLFIITKWFWTATPITHPTTTTHTHTHTYTHTSKPLPLKRPHPLTSSFPHNNLSSFLKLVSPREFLINSKHVVFIQLYGSWTVWTLPWTWTREVAAFHEITFSYFNFLFFFFFF